MKDVDRTILDECMDVIQGPACKLAVSGKILSANTDFLRIVGYSEFDVRTQRLWELVHAGDATSVREHIVDLFETTRATNFDARLGNGRRFTAYRFQAVSLLGGRVAMIHALPLSTRYAQGVRAPSTDSDAVEADNVDGGGGEQETRQQDYNDLAVQRFANSAFFALTPDMACIAGMDGFFKRINPAFSATLGYTEKELLGRPFVDFVHMEDVQKTIDEVSNLSQDQATVGFENRYRHKNGTYRVISWKAVPFVEKDAIFAIARDVTEMVEKNRRKNEFVSTVSHELRTPLTSIRGSLGLLAGGIAGPLPAEANRLLDIAVTNSDRLIRLINDLLDLQKIEAGAMQFQNARIHLPEVIQTTLGDLAALAGESGIVLATEIAETSSVDGDFDRLVQVVTNLVANAIKFSKEKQTVMVRCGDHGDGMVRVSVTDCGPGISPERQGAIFDRYGQGTSDVRGVGGTGLGLTISRAIIDQHCGSIGVESELGKGSTFYFDVPASEPKIRLGTENGDGDVNSASVHRVAELLIVEPNKSTARILSAILENEGYRFRVVASVADAETYLATNEPMLVVCDVGDPERDGFAILSTLRGSKRTASIPVVAINSDVASSAVADVGGPMMVDYLEKPLDYVRLLGSLRRALREPGAARVLVVEDDDSTREIIGAHLKSLGCEYFFAQNGAEALALAGERRPDAIILDIGLPDIDGFSVVEELRARDVGGIPLVVYTAADISAQDLSKISLGVTRYLEKSRTTTQEFIAVVREILDGIADAREKP